MQARLVGEGRGADVGRLAVGHAVEDVVEQPADPGDVGEGAALDAGLEAAGVGLLEEQRRDQRHEVGVAAALAEAVERALDLPRAGVDGGERVGDGVAGVVVGVDAEAVAGDAGLDDGAGDGADLVGQRAAVGVAEDDPAGAGVERGLQAGERVVGVRLPAVEEMLGVEQRLAALGGDVGDRLADGGEVLGELDAEGGGDVEVVGLADEGDGRRAGVEDPGEHVVVLGRAPVALGHAEGGEGGVPERRRGGEEGVVGRIGAGPAALDVVEAEAVEGAGDGGLVVGGEVDALALLPVAEGGVEEGEALAGHAVDSVPSAWRGRNRARAPTRSRLPGSIHDLDPGVDASASRIAIGLLRSLLQPAPSASLGDRPTSPSQADRRRSPRDCPTRRR